MAKKPSIDELYGLLSDVCASEFGFNPKQVSSSMRYMGTTAGKHVFRDRVTHSQIVLRVAAREATLLKVYNGNEYWFDEEIAYYRKTDEELVQETRKAVLKMNIVINSRFYLSHTGYLQSLHRSNPKFTNESLTPIDGAIGLVKQATADGDADLASLVASIGESDVTKIAWDLLEAVYLDMAGGD